MAVDSKMKTAGLAIGAAIATVGGWLGLRAHDEHIRDEEKARLQAEYLHAKAQGGGAIDRKNAEIVATIQELGKSNPEGNFSQRFRKGGTGIAAEAQDPENLARQPDFVDYKG